MREFQQDSSEEKEEARDADPDIEARQDFGNIVGDTFFGIMWLRKRNCMFRRTIFRYL